MFPQVNQRFKLSYAEMKKHMIRIDMWKVSHLTINEYFGSVSRTLWEC